MKTRGLLVAVLVALCAFVAGVFAGRPLGAVRAPLAPLTSSEREALVKKLYEISEDTLPFFWLEELQYYSPETLELAKYSYRSAARRCAMEVENFAPIETALAPAPSVVIPRANPLSDKPPAR